MAAAGVSSRVGESAVFEAVAARTGGFTACSAYTSLSRRRRPGVTTPAS